jgi:hypothetical protein
MTAIENVTVTERIGKIERTTLGFEDHGILTAWLHCNYGSSAQGLGGYALDGPYDKEAKVRLPNAECGRWVVGVMKACGVQSWEKVAGRTVIVMMDGDGWNARPVGIRPLPTEKGEPFWFAGEEDHA